MDATAVIVIRWDGHDLSDMDSRRFFEKRASKPGRKQNVAFTVEFSKFALLRMHAGIFKFKSFIQLQVYFWHTFPTPEPGLVIDSRQAGSRRRTRGATFSTASGLNNTLRVIHGIHHRTNAVAVASP